MSVCPSQSIQRRRTSDQCLLGALQWKNWKRSSARTVICRTDTHIYIMQWRPDFGDFSHLFHVIACDEMSPQLSSFFSDAHLRFQKYDHIHRPPAGVSVRMSPKEHVLEEFPLSGWKVFLSKFLQKERIYVKQSFCGCISFQQKGCFDLFANIKKFIVHWIVTA
jgi:hypothetical protein